MKNSYDRKLLFSNSVIHFLVDLTCIYALTGVLIPKAGSHEEWLFWAVLYNFLAFALPFAWGLLADCLERVRNLKLASIGCLLTAAGCFSGALPILMILLMGIGNGLYHVGAGREILKRNPEKDSPLGIFISTGALGVYLGSFWGKSSYYLWTVLGMVLLLGSLGLWMMKSEETYQERKPIHSIHKEKDFPKGIVAMGCLFFVVCLRSYYGSILQYSWKQGFLIGLLFTLSVAGGKFLGGVLADYIGVRKAAALSLGLAGLLALGSFSWPALGCGSIFFFNMTMPITLSWMAKLLPGKEGFAFGSLMLALFLGTLPTMVFQKVWLFSPLGLSFLCLCSLVGIWFPLSVKGVGKS